nr:zf-CCHC domain-containing protein/UBN2 domain-containing protein [Tanacetum cinerariifolium]
MVLYNALPKREYERVFMCKMAKDIWKLLLITHQGNRQVKDNKIDLLVQQYEQFSILKEESVDSGFARSNTITTSLKALDEESKDLSSLALDELIGNLKVDELIMEKDSKFYKRKKERVKSIALEAKKESSDDDTSKSRSNDKEYAMAVRNFKKFFRNKGKFVRKPREEKKSFWKRDDRKSKSDRKCFRCDDPNNLIGDCTKPSRKKDQKVLLLAWDRVSEIKNVIGNKRYKPEDVQELFCKLLNDVQNIHEELAEYINIPSWNNPTFSSHDDDEEDYTIAITPEEPDNSLSMEDGNLDTIPTMELDEVIKSSVEDLVPIPSESEGIPDNIYFSIDNIDYVEASPPDSELVSLEEVKDDNLRKKLLNINLLIAKIKSLNDNPTHDHVLKPLSLFLIPSKDSNSFLEKSDTSLFYSDNSFPEFETFRNHTEETNSGSTTTHANYSLPNIVDSEIRENVLSATNVNLPLEEDHSPLFAYVVWIFLSFLTYPVVPPNLLSFGNEDTIFDPGISNYYFSSFMPGVSHQSGTFMKFNVYPNHLNESPMEILSSTTFPKNQ